MQHVVSRFVDREFRLDEQDARAEYLRRAGEVFNASDWRPLAFALMSSHVHWALLAGDATSDSWVRPLHVGFAAWANRKQQRLGPVFADRHRTIVCDQPTAAGLIAYIHNNPVRAGVVADPLESDWTSHRALVGVAPAPPWLDVGLALDLCGYPDTRAGRRRWHALVLSRMNGPKDVAYSGEGLVRARREARGRLGGPVEVESPVLSGHLARAEVRSRVLVARDCVLRPRWHGKPAQVIDSVLQKTDITPEALRSRARDRPIARARQLCLQTWTRGLHRPATEMASALGLSSSGASYLLATATPEVRAVAAAIAETLLRSPAGASWGQKRPRSLSY